MQAIYNDSRANEILRNVIPERVPSELMRMLQGGAVEVTVRPEPWEESGVAARVSEEKAERREREDFERRKRKGVMVGGRK